MISTSNISLRFGGKKLFEDVNVKFTPGNCYGLIGANGAGKSTFLKVLAREIEPNTGEVHISPSLNLSMLRQNHFEFDNVPVLKTVMRGNRRLSAVIEEKDALYAKPDFSEEDGNRASELETQFAEMDGWNAESDAGSMLEGLGIPVTLHEKLVGELDPALKVKVLLAQALFGSPDVLLLDEPTNNLDIYAIQWLENFILNFPNTVIVVSHDRYFLNKVCSHIADIDFTKITVYTGNYDFWRQASELNVRLRSDQLKKNSDRAEELKSFIARFSANASKSSQASSRMKQLEKLDLEALPVSTRKAPYVGFTPKREAGSDILTVDRLNVTADGAQVLKNFSFIAKKGDKIILIGKNDNAKTALFEVLAGRMKADSGTITWGVTTSVEYFPADNTDLFKGGEATLVDWLRQYSEEKDESFIRGFLGKMLFSRDEALKKPSVLSGGEKVRCILSKMMLSGANVLMFDGPTAHLDLESISSVNDGLVKFKGTVLFATHDHEFIQSTANRIIEIADDGTLLDDQEMTFDEYIERKKPKH